METTTALLIAIPVLVVLAGVLLFASARRRDTGEVIGALARETRRRDRGAVAPADAAEAPVTGKEVEAAAALERRESSRAVATIDARPPVVWVPPDPEVLGVTRRQFFNRGIVSFFVLGLSGFGAACLAFLWPKLGGGFGSVINIGSTAAIDAKITDGQGFAYYP
jgi:cytochrome b6-f complex iron-sulfur subunit